jgi:hypothetical protein
MTIDEFSSSIKTIRRPQYYDDAWGHGKHQKGYHHYLYVDENLEIVNPYTKKDENKRVVKSIVSTCSREDAIEKTYLFILKTANESGLYEESVCDLHIAERQLNYLKYSQQCKQPN